MSDFDDFLDDFEGSIDAKNKGISEGKEALKPATEEEQGWDFEADARSSKKTLQPEPIINTSRDVQPPENEQDLWGEFEEQKHNNQQEMEEDVQDEFEFEHSIEKEKNKTDDFFDYKEESENIKDKSYPSAQKANKTKTEDDFFDFEEKSENIKDNSYPSVHSVSKKDLNEDSFDFKEEPVKIDSDSNPAEISEKGNSPLMIPKKEKPKKRLSTSKRSASKKSISRKSTPKKKSSTRPPVEKKKELTRKPSLPKSKNSFRISSNSNKSKINHESSRLTSARSKLSVRAFKQGFPSLIDLIAENKALHQELRDYNQKLSRMIDYKGFSKLVNRIKHGKPVEFKNRPVSAKVRTLENEINNNLEAIKLKKEDLKRLGMKKKKLLNPIYLTDINREIVEYERKIKNMKKDISHIDAESKKEGKQVARLNTNIHQADSVLAINSLIGELDLFVRSNYEITSKIDEYKLQKVEQDKLVDKIKTKHDELQAKLDKLGYVKDTPLILEYKRIKAEYDKKAQYIRIIENKNEKQMKIKKRDLEEKVLENNILEDRIKNQEELISEQRQRLLDLIEIAKHNQSQHGKMLLERFKQGIELDEERDEQLRESENIIDAVSTNTKQEQEHSINNNQESLDEVKREKSRVNESIERSKKKNEKESVDKEKKEIKAESFKIVSQNNDVDLALEQEAAKKPAFGNKPNLFAKKKDANKIIEFSKSPEDNKKLESSPSQDKKNEWGFATGDQEKKTDDVLRLPGDDESLELFEEPNSKKDEKKTVTPVSNPIPIDLDSHTIKEEKPFTLGSKKPVLMMGGPGAGMGMGMGMNKPGFMMGAQKNSNNSISNKPMIPESKKTIKEIVEIDAVPMKENSKPKGDLNDDILDILEEKTQKPAEKKTADPFGFLEDDTPKLNDRKKEAQDPFGIGDSNIKPGKPKIEQDDLFDPFGEDKPIKPTTETKKKDDLFDPFGDDKPIKPTTDAKKKDDLFDPFGDDKPIKPTTETKKKDDLFDPFGDDKKNNTFAQKKKSDDKLDPFGLDKSPALIGKDVKEDDDDPFADAAPLDDNRRKLQFGDSKALSPQILDSSSDEF